PGGCRWRAMNCPDCSTLNRPGAARCRQCGTVLPPSCVSCGASVPPGADLCRSCRTDRVPRALGIGAEDAVEIEPSRPTRASEYDLHVGFIGRQAELERLLGILASSADGREMAFVTLTGAPGIGKTRLASELGRLARSALPRTRMLHASCGGSGA